MVFPLLGTVKIPKERHRQGVNTCASRVKAVVISYSQPDTAGFAPLLGINLPPQPGLGKLFRKLLGIKPLSPIHWN